MAIAVARRWRVLVVWVVSVALFAGAVGGGVLLPEGAATAQVAAPVAAGSVPGVELTVGGAARSVEVADYFTGTVASYAATSGDVGVVSVGVSGSAVTLKPAGAGSTTVTVTATNASGSAEQVFGVKVLPAGCLASLGTLAAGSITTSGGSWDRDDGCRSSNAGHRSHLYSAGYVSFTVSEAVVARFSLSATEGKRLFLLAGAGTGGRVLGSSLMLSKSAPTSLWRTLSPGSYTLEATTYFAAREADFSVVIDSMALVPPESCLASKGTLTAGSTTTVSGAWARSEGCRSVNASTNRQHRHYADYVTFTVTDTVEARVRLASTIGKRLILLEGAGTGGAVVGWPRTGYLTFPAVLWQKLSAGTYTIEATTFDTAVEGDYTLTIALAATAPTKGDVLADQEIPIGQTAAQIDVSGAFSGTVDTYSATSGDTTVVTASVAGSVVTLSGVAVGTATVTVTATNTAGSVSQTFTATVSAATAPQTTGVLSAQTVTVGGTLTIDVADAFTGAVDSYGATSGDTTVATVSTTGSEITLNGVAAGAATVTVTATNTAGSAERSFGVTVTPVAPSVGVVLGDRSVSVGGVVDVDVASGFVGEVDSYVVSSDDASVVGVGLAGSVVSLRGVGVGSATVTVEASNGGGGVSQSFVVSVAATAAPGFGEPFAARSLVVSEVVSVDASSGFAGLVDSFEAVSGDVGIVGVEVAGSTVLLTGVGVGSARVTVTAVNSGGRAARAFTVTVGALAAPAASRVLAGRSMAAGEIIDLDVAAGFSGMIREYRASSSKPSLLGVSVEGSVVRLVGRGAGSVVVTVTAVNASGMTSQTFTVTLSAAGSLSVALSAPAYCLASEGVTAPDGGREGVGVVEVSYAITGGYQPYEVTVGDQNGSEPAGAFEVSCARDGVDPATVGADVNVVESGPKTIRVTVTDSAGTTETAEVEVAVAEDVYTTEYHDTTMRAGRTYVLGDGDDWTLITLPDGLNLRFIGLSENSRAHFEETTTGVEVVLDWHSGAEVGHDTAPPPNADALQGGIFAARLQQVTATFAQLAASARKDVPGVERKSITGKDWRPYAGLPDSTHVAVHPRVLKGQTITVCTPETNTQFHDQIREAINAWHTKIRERNPAYTRDIFEFNRHCPSDDKHHIQVLVNTEKTLEDNCNTKGIAGCAATEVTSDNPPTIGGNRIYIKDTKTYHKGSSNERAAQLWVMVHELGHFLGLGDRYNRKTKECVVSVESVMGFDDKTKLDAKLCGSYNIEDVDVDDLVAIYSPGALVGVSVVRSVGPVDFQRWRLRSGLGPADLRGNHVANAFWYAVYAKGPGLTGAPRYIGGFGPSDHYFVPDEEIIGVPMPLSKLVGWEFWVIGVTGGDVKGSGRVGLGLRETQSLDLLEEVVGAETWWLGDRAVVAGLPGVPVSVSASPRDEAVLLSWRHDRGASEYTVYWHDREMTVHDGASVPSRSTGTELVRVAGSPVDVSVRVEGLTNGEDYFFRVRSENEGLNYVSGLSAEVSATPEADSLIEEARVRFVDDNCVSHGAGWVKVTGDDGSYCAFEDSRKPDRTPKYDCTGPYESYRLVPRVGREPWCVKKESVRAKVRHSEPFCETSGYVVSPDKSRCEKVVTRPLTERVEYSCPKGYDRVIGFVAGAVTRHCSRTISVPATRLERYTCEPGFSKVIVLGVTLCRKVEEEPATPVTRYRCPSGFELKINVLPGGLVTRRCVKTETKAARVVTTYVCASGYTKVPSPLGNPYCQKTVTVAATRTLSCSSGFTRVGSACRKYTYTNPVNGRCPPGRTTVPAGFGVLCRKTTIVPATVTYSCSADYTLSGTKCSKVLTRPVTTRISHVCDAGFVRSGTTCTKTTTRTPTTVQTHVCPIGYVRDGLQCTKTTTVAATRVVEYDCDAGYTPVGTSCEKTDTKPVIVTRTTTCPAKYKPAGSQCSRTLTEPISRTKTPYCDSGDPPVAVTNGKGETEQWCFTTRTGAATELPPTYTCPATPKGEPPYKRVNPLSAAPDCRRTLIRAIKIVKEHYCASGYKRIQTTDKDTTKYLCRLVKTSKAQ